MPNRADLLARMGEYELRTLPKSMLFIGGDDKGKEEALSKLCERLGLELRQAVPPFDDEAIAEMQHSPIAALYEISLSGFDKKEQNSLLKVVEEPMDAVYVAVLTDSDGDVLETLRNRCVEFRVDAYTKEELKAECGDGYDELAYEVCDSPEELRSVDKKQFEDLKALCEKIVKSIGLASYPNAMKLALSINFKDDYSKFDFKQFFGVLKAVSLKAYEKGESQGFAVYKTIVDSFGKARGRKLAKESFALGFFDSLWRNVHEAIRA